MKGMYLGRRFYRQMFGLVLLIPVVMYAASLYPVIARAVSQIALGARFCVGIVLSTWPGEDGLIREGPVMNFDLLGSRTLSSVGLSAYRPMSPQSIQSREPVENP